MKISINKQGGSIIRIIFKTIVILIVIFLVLVLLTAIIEGNKNKTGEGPQDADNQQKSDGTLESTAGKGSQIKDKKEEKIVQAKVAEEYGVNASALVTIINSNAFVGNILKDYQKINLKIHDAANNKYINLKVSLNNGKITLVEDGLHGNAGIAFVAPLGATLNIISNVNNINIFNFLGFALAVQTEPPEAKQALIQKVLSNK